MGLAIASVCHAEEMRLDHALLELQDQGHRVVFSSELVPAGLVVEIGAVTLIDVRQALRRAGLDLTRWNGYWLVIVAKPLAEGASAVSELVPPTEKIETIIVAGTRHRLVRQVDSGSHTTMLAEELSMVPTLAGDAMRVT
ncbi:MAG: hypothetical protein O7B25_10065, partial [Gammaproteobacteria bacterium]|nr:hypothetical protein [Gammaproteobacteria bacterium]